MLPPIGNSDPGSHSGPSYEYPLSPTVYVPSFLSRDKNSAFSSLVDWRQIEDHVLSTTQQAIYKMPTTDQSAL